MKKLLLLASAAFCSALPAFAQTYTVTPSPATYPSAGGNIVFTVSLAYPAETAAVGFSAKPPGAAWKFVSAGGTNAPDEIKPVANDVTDPAVATSTFDFAYATPPAGSASFTFTLNVPAGMTGNQVVTFSGLYRVGGVRTDVTVASVTLTQTPEAPVITTQPASATVASGANATFTVAASGFPVPTLQWQRSTDGGNNWSALVNDSAHAGVTTATVTVNAATLGQSGHRYRAVATNSVGSATSNGAAALTITQAPQITQQPQSQAVLAGTAVTFTVAATGSPTLAYQWYFTPASSTTPQLITGATAASYTINNAQTANAGDYNVVVSNGVSPNATSASAQLTIAARIVRVASVTGAPGSNVVVPVQLLAAGNENALGFSVSFDAAQLTYVSAVVGANAADASLNPNVSAASSGRVGVALAKPTNAVWAAGTQEVVKFTFTLGAGVTNGTVLTLAFVDTPVGREISDALANALPTAYQSGTVTALAGFEADMNGNGTVSITDWVRVGRIVAGLDAVPTGIDFLKADCSPRSALGNGILSVTDWVQAGRYAAGLDPLTPVGGPGPATP